MAFGSFIVESGPAEVKKQEKAVRKTKTGKVPELQKKPELLADDKVFSILLVGRSQAAMRDYLCSLNQNMNEVLSGSGLSYYTREYAAITDIVAAKKHLDGYFWTGQETEYVCADPEEEKACVNYIFSISPSGNQQVCLDFNFCCMTPQEAESAGAASADAVWILAEEPSIEEEDTYAKALGRFLGLLQNKGTSAPDAGNGVFILLSQFEHRVHFKGNETENFLNEGARKKLYDSCRQAFGGIRSASAAMLFLLQIYGGLQYVGRNEQGAPVLSVSRNGFYQKYLPAGCHLPLLYLLEASVPKDAFWQGREGEEVWAKLQKSFAAYRTGDSWKPQPLGTGGNADEKE